MHIKYIFNHVFVIGLLVLMLNDYVLKGMFGNWFTGKLSDFAGILILPMFIAFLFKWNSNKSIVLTVLFFVFWKSSLSQGFIDSFNALGVLPIGRVVDYSDFLSFLILPFSKYVIDHVEDFEIKLESKIGRELSLASLVVSSFVILTATSKDLDIVVPSSIQNCCAMEPVNAELGNGKIYIPTAFTPDDNGNNEFFYPRIDSNIVSIDEFIVFNANFTDTVFARYNILEMVPFFGFDGSVNNQVIAAEYNYKISATSKDEISATFQGVVCCIPCRSGTVLQPPDSLLNCAFPVQFDSEVGYDEGISPGEAFDCFQ